MPAASACGSLGGTRRAVSPSAPATSGNAPPVVATTGVPHAIASTSGRENPSNSDGTTANSALRSSCSRSSSEIRPVKRTGRE